LSARASRVGGHGEAERSRRDQVDNQIELRLVGRQVWPLIGDGEQRRRHGEQFFTPNFLLAPRSHRRRYSIPTDTPRATLQRPIGLLDRGDEDFRARLEIALVPLHVNNNGRVGGDKDFLFSVLVFQRQRLPINRGDNCSNVRVGHCALGPKTPMGSVLPRFRALPQERYVLRVRSGCHLPSASP
jgi:hypothetical protein